MGSYCHFTRSAHWKGSSTSSFWRKVLWQWSVGFLWDWSFQGSMVTQWAIHLALSAAPSTLPSLSPCPLFLLSLHWRVNSIPTQRSLLWPEEGGGGITQNNPARSKAVQENPAWDRLLAGGGGVLLCLVLKETAKTSSVTCIRGLDSPRNIIYAFFFAWIYNPW